jgi:hypothetical protein
MVITYCDKCGVLLVEEQDRDVGCCLECVQGKKERRSGPLRDSGRIPYHLLLTTSLYQQKN